MPCRTGVGKGFLKRTPFTREPRPTTVSWDLAELKVSSINKHRGSHQVGQALLAVCLIKDWCQNIQRTQKTESRKQMTKFANGLWIWTEFAKEKIKVGKKQLKNCSLALTFRDEHEKNCGTPSSLVRMTKTIQQRTANAGEGAARGTSTIVGGWPAGAAPLEITVGSSLKAKNESTIWTSYTTPWYLPKGLDMLTHKHLLNYVNSALFTIAKK